MSMPRTTRCQYCGSPPNFGPGAFTELQKQGRDTTLECAADRLLLAIKKLSENPPDQKPITYFEASPTKDPECYKRWVELNDAGALVRKLLADRKASESESASAAEPK